MITITEDVIEQVAMRIVEEVSPLRIVLFGSWARGEMDRRSDLDLLVIEDEPFGPNRSRFEEVARIHEALYDLGVPLDILVYSSDEIEKWKSTTNHIVRTVMREGRVLYERT